MTAVMFLFLNRNEIRRLGWLLGIRAGLRPARLVWFLLILVPVVFGSIKPPAQTYDMILRTLRNGKILDPAHTLATEVEKDVVEQFAVEQAKAITNLSSQVNTYLATVRALTNQLHGVKKCYLGMDIPRSIPGEHVSLNPSGTFEQFEVDGEGFAVAYHSFNRSFTRAPILRFPIRYGDTWYLANVLSNSFPTTVTVNGAECVKYFLKLPTELRGVPLKPIYELKWGSATTNIPLMVGGLGIRVASGSVTNVPFTGTDTNTIASGTLEIDYHGGIAIRARLNGTPIGE